MLLSNGTFQSVENTTAWGSGDIGIRLKGNSLQIAHGSDKPVEIMSFAFNFIEAEHISVEESSEDALILRLVFDETDGFRSDFPKELLLRIERRNNTLHFSAGHAAFNHISIRMRDRNEHYFGLIEKLYPNNSKNPDLRGNTVDVDVYAQGNRDYAENYASAYSAFYMSSLGYGSFFDTFAKGRYRFAIDGVTEIYHQTGSLDWYLFFGPGGDEIHAQYYDVIGRPKFVPVWACGPIFWRDRNIGSEEVLADIRKFTDMKIPLTACMIDRPYSDGGHRWSKMNFSEEFANPEEWIRTINKQFGMELLTWVAPMTFTDPYFPGLLPGFQNYMDLTDPEALAEFERRLATQQYSIGVKGHKMDRADESFPMTARWHEPVNESETRNTYAYLYSKVIHEFLSRAHGRDQFNYARTAFHRSQPYLSALWGGDSRSNWAGMAGSQANAMRVGFQGFPMWGNDTGGYLGEGRIDETLYMRWIRWSAWNGMFEIKIDGAGGSGEDRPPWKYSSAFQEVFRDACEQRMRLLPYIYSCANTSYKNGVLMKPLAYVYPGDANTYRIWDEYVFGNAFLVAPVFVPSGLIDIYLPEGTWYDFNDPGKKYAGGEFSLHNIPADEIPVFVKRNTIYVTGDVFRGNSRTWQGELKNAGKLEIHIFPGPDGSESAFDYVDFLDDDLEKTMHMSSEGNAVLFLSEPLSNPATVYVKCEKKPLEAVLNGEPVVFEYDPESGVAAIKAKAHEEIRMRILN